MIALIDCNNFYCACERVFQPSLARKALLVLSNNDGCAIARSDEAKALGIKMGTPAFMIEEQIRQQGIEVFSSNYALYGDMSARVMQVIRAFVPRTEVYSIDEIFADLSTLKYQDLHQLACSLRQAVAGATGIPVSVGIAPTKTLAKMANRYAKKTRPDEGIFMARAPEAVSAMLAFTPVEGIWGIGPQHAAFLQEHGFLTAADFISAPEDWVRKHLSVVGLRTLHELKGNPVLPWEEEPPAKKNIRTSRSFGKLVKTKKDLAQAVAKFTASCAEKLRKEKRCARKWQLFIQTNIHRREDPQYFQSLEIRLASPTNSTAELMRYSMKALDAIFQPGYHYQKAGVMALDLVPQGEGQLPLFGSEKRARDQQLMQTLDEVNGAFGRDIVRFGVQDYGNHWKLRQERLSDAFTSRLDSIPKAG